MLPRIDTALQQGMVSLITCGGARLKVWIVPRIVSSPRGTAGRWMTVVHPARARAVATTAGTAPPPG